MLIKLPVLHHRSAVLARILKPHSYLSTMAAVNGVSKPKDRSQLIPFSSRLKEGRALAQDVWSIYKCVDRSAPV